MLFRPHLNKILVAFHAARAQVKRQINASIDKRKCVNDENDNGVGDESHKVQITHKETSDDEGQSSDDNDATIVKSIMIILRLIKIIVMTVFVLEITSKLLRVISMGILPS